MKQDEMPVGFSMVLAQNPNIMQKFMRRGEDQRKREINCGMF